MIALLILRKIVVCYQLKSFYRPNQDEIGAFAHKGKVLVKGALALYTK